jgi:transcriptional regulator with XRE-family HTH domain
VVVDRKQLLARAVKERREELGITQAQLRDRALAKKMNLALSTVIAVEAGERDWGRMQARTRQAFMTALEWGPEQDEALQRGEPPAAGVVATSPVAGPAFTEFDVALDEVLARIQQQRHIEPSMLAYYALDWLDESHRRDALTGIGRWLTANPGYANNLNA